MAKDYYSILGVPKTADNDEIKKAFRKLAHKYHPDKNQGDKVAEDKFKEINEAYQTLSDDKKKAAYDRFGSDGPSGNGQGFGGFESSGFGFDFGGMGDIFSDFFSGQSGSGGRRQRKGQDIEVMINISLADSYTGITRSFSIQRNKDCSDCNATGAKKGTQSENCKDCQGQGVRMEARRTILGMMNTQVECRTCQGTGSVAKEKCTTCRGRGINQVRDEVTLNVPAGVQHGSVMTLPVRGEAVMGGITGDLYVRVHIDEDKYWRREGLDLVRTLDIKLTDALLGASLSLDTFLGKQNITVAAGTQTGDTIVERGKGFAAGTRKGDVRYIAQITIPKKLSHKAKEYATKLKEEGY